MINQCDNPEKLFFLVNIQYTMGLGAWAKKKIEEKLEERRFDKAELERNNAYQPILSLEPIFNVY